MISGASVSAIGAFEKAKVGWFDLAAQTYRPIAVDEQSEVLSLLGGPYNSGILTGGVKPGATHDYVAAPTHLIEKGQKIEATCERHGVELGAAVLQFPLFHLAVCSVIPGALSAAEVKQNIGRLSVKIPVEFWSELKRGKLLDPNAPTPN
jgi:D-threo-aldose 1-dehydrogenase